MCLEQNAYHPWCARNRQSSVRPRQTLLKICHETVAFFETLNLTGHLENVNVIIKEQNWFYV